MTNQLLLAGLLFSAVLACCGRQTMAAPTGDYSEQDPENLADQDDEAQALNGRQHRSLQESNNEFSPADFGEASNQDQAQQFYNNQNQNSLMAAYHQQRQRDQQAAQQAQASENNEQNSGDEGEDDDESDSMSSSVEPVSGRGRSAVSLSADSNDSNDFSPRTGSSELANQLSADELESVLDAEPHGLDSNIANAKIELSPTDMATAAGHHHHHGHYVHGWLKMGAETGKKGAFKWHDKHPVGGKGRR